jgi:hypothetical protein
MTLTNSNKFYYLFQGWTTEEKAKAALQDVSDWFTAAYNRNGDWTVMESTGYGPTGWKAEFLATREVAAPAEAASG